MVRDMAETVRAIETIADRKQKRIERVEARDRVYLVDQSTGTALEIEPRLEDIAAHIGGVDVVTLRSVVDWAAAFSPDVKGEVRIGRKDKSMALAPRLIRGHEKRETATKAFFSDFMPPPDWVSLDAFQSWLDRVRPGMTTEQRELIDAAFGAVSATSAQVVELQVDGAVIQAEVRIGEKVTGKRPLPRHLVSVVPFGDPEFKYLCRFILSARIQNGAILFRAAHDPNDGAHEAWVLWADTLLRASLPAGWIVLVTP